MPNYFVEYHKRSDGQAIVEYDTLETYCQIQGQPKQHVADVLTSCPRVEYYVKDDSGKTVAVFFLMRTIDMHHGPVAMFCADWVHPMHRRNRQIHKLRMWYLKRFCETFGTKKYQRSRHLSPTVQIQITKEV
ncbi:host specificity protein A [Aeromonas phage phiA014S]|uniref:Host specificity protein A n=1 Tax=Aeromonas phage phiA014S TaxID=3119845 RepID=A0ABZ2CNW8_9CAUD